MTMRPMCGWGPRLGLALALAATPAAAQRGVWIPVRCDLKPNHYLVNAGLLYLKSATEGRFQEQIQKDLKDANKNLVQAITANGQDQNPAAWYYLGRYYGMVKDAAGADSAFRRAEQLKPACKDDIGFWRRDLWVPLFNGAVQAYNAGQSDSAIHLLQQANAIYAGEPTGFKLLGALFFNANNADSAARYFRLAVAASSDPKYAADKKEALFNVAASYYRAQRWSEAEAAYRDYLALAPNDAQALAGLAAVFSSLGKTDSAAAIYAKIVNNADSVDAMGLFFAGTSIFTSAPALPDTAPLGTSCRAEARRTGRTLTARAISARCDSVTARRVHDYDAEAAVSYRLAAKAFEAGLAKNPFYRDGLYNLANTYLALHDSVKMLPVAKRLYAVDPLSRNTLRLLAQAFQFQKQPDSTLRYLTVADSAMPIEVTVSGFQPGDQNASLSGVLTNYRTLPDSATLVRQCRAAGPAATAATRCGYQKVVADTKAKLANPPLKLTFEFLSATGAVVATQSVDVPAIEPGGNRPFQLQAVGAKITAWRYKQG
jgi:tetratricopeptide (TPR) repeat protein